MSFELIHTSVPRGLRGDSGFATAVATRALPVGLESVLAELSAYDFDANRCVGVDRVDWAHRILTLRGKSFTVLSRVAPCGNDSSGRPNRIAHHLVLDADERASAGPAWMLDAFSGFSHTVPPIAEPSEGPQLPTGSLEPRRATAWESAGFDPGWAGIVARTVLEAPNSVCYVVLPNELNALPLAADVLALLPIERRWHVSFSTRFQRLPAAAKCQIRFVRNNATGLSKLLNEPGVRQVTVTASVAADASPAAEAARSGRFVESTLRAPPSTRVVPVLHATPQLNGHERVGVYPASATTPRALSALNAPTVLTNTGDSEHFLPLFDANERATKQAPPPRARAASTALSSVPPLALFLFAYSAVATAIAVLLFVFAAR